MAMLYNLRHQKFKWRKQLRSRCLIEEQQISFILAKVARTRHHPVVLVPRRIDTVVQVNRKQEERSLVNLPKNSEAKAAVGRPDLPQLENQPVTTHVESILIPRLDEGSSPSSSTMYYRTKSDSTRQTSDYQVVPGFSFIYSFRLRTEKRRKKDPVRHSSGTNQALTF